MVVCSRRFPGFAGGTTLLHHGDLWFMKESTRFNPAKMTFVIGVVPYPADDGEGGILVTTTDVEVIMSCQGTTYFEIMELLSRTVGGGSHFGDGGWWPLAASIIKSKDSPVIAINEVIDKYKQAMIFLGYSVQ